MKKAIDVLVLRSVFALLLGTILILWSGDAIRFLVIIIGIFLILLGLIPIVIYLTRNRQLFPHMSFPHVGLFILMFGLSLVVYPEFFVNVLMYILGIILVIGGFQQISTLIGASKWTTVPIVFYLLPALILIAGILVLFNPFGAAESIFILAGVTCLIYGISDFVSWVKFRR
jgi:uncharacterized membrane protein HdeD (DUF308 family)